MTQAYDHLSEWFEYLNDDCDYPAWSQYFLSGLAALGAGRKGLEVGCGSVLNPGTVVGSHSNIYPLSSVRGFVPGNSIYKKQGEVVEKRED